MRIVLRKGRGIARKEMGTNGRVIRCSLVVPIWSHIAVPSAQPASTGNYRTVDNCIDKTATEE